MLRLKSLYIKDYKNIHKQTFDFSSNTGYITLIGLNGSGKSNLLEAISLILDELYGINHSEQDNVEGYEISYEIDGVPYTCTTLDENKKNIIPHDTEGKKLPSSVIACYSGEDLRLWHMAYMTYYMRFFNEALHGKDYVPQTMYINKYCWKIAIISLLFSLNRNVQQFVKDVLHIDVGNVTIQFTYNEIDNPQPHDAYNWIDRVKKEYGTNAIPLEELRDFGLGNTLHTDLTEDKLIFFYLYFLSMPKKSPRQPVDKIITDITIKLGAFEFDALSEGEKKMILIACITKILGDDNTLVLLDEPDAHTHIAMKKDLLNLIADFEGQTIMTTHSPMFLNKRLEGYNGNNIFYMRDGIIEKTEPLKYLSELTDNTVDYFEGMFILSSRKILVTEGPFDILYVNHAINKLSEDNPNYRKIKDQVAFIHSGGANNASALYTQTLYPALSHIDKIVFLFDYDTEGFNGAEDVRAAIEKHHDTISVTLFYQNDYTTLVSRKPVEKDSESYMVEDLFSVDSYKRVIDKIHVNSHKEIRNITWHDVLNGNKRPKTTPDAIKYYIQEQYSSFGKDWLSNYKPLLDKLLEVFNL